ncbi:MAG: glycosyltransferase [Ardenticatenaceae bacterium]|nr:glycosyltransferase [Ardenticatenaceae bacterium]
MTKVLFLVGNQVERGSFWRSSYFAKELSQLGYDVTYLIISRTRRFGFVERQYKGFTLIETPDLFPVGFDPWDTLNRMWWLNGRSFDLIQIFENRPVVIFPALYIKKKLNIPLVMDWCDWFGRGGSVEERTNPLIRTVLRPVETFFEETFRHRADGTTVINSVLRQKAIDLGVPPETILSIPNGANTTDFQPKNLQQVRKRLGLPVDAPILGYSGVMFHRDGLLMAAAFEQIHQIYPEARLLLIGYVNIDVEQYLPTAAHAVIRTGPLNDFSKVVDYIAASNIGWLTLVDSGANRGRFPLKAFDFMAAGRPLISTDVADLGQMVREKQVGLVTKDDPTELARTTVELLRDPVAQDEMGRRGRHVIETEYAGPVVTAKLDNFYQRLLNGWRN